MAKQQQLPIETLAKPADLFGPVTFTVRFEMNGADDYYSRFTHLEVASDSGHDAWTQSRWRWSQTTLLGEGAQVYREIGALRGRLSAF